MILLRRGRPTPPLGPSYDVEVALEIAPASRRPGRESVAPWRPPIEVFETERELLVRAEIAGLSDQEVSVLVDNGELIIRGERNVNRGVDHCLYHESRIRYGPFEASVRLPFPVDVASATADYLEGFLTVQLPRLAAIRVRTRNVGGDEVAQRGGQWEHDQD